MDVLRSSHLHSPACLSAETIINLAENGVHRDVFINLLKSDMRERIDRLTTYDDNDRKSLLRLWTAVGRKGGVLTARLAREMNGKARSSGYVFEDRMLESQDSNGLDGLDDLDELASETVDRSSPWWWDPMSGQPSSLEETVMYLLDSGFCPGQCNILRAKLREVAESWGGADPDETTPRVKRGDVVLLESAYRLGVPHLRLSDRLLSSSSRQQVYSLRGAAANQETRRRRIRKSLRLWHSQPRQT